nr:WD repeat-containing protein 70 isoform X2 [Odocoileus virginianus texanus]
MHFRKQKESIETPDGFNRTPGSVALIHRQPARAALPMEASVPPRKTPLLALAATLTLEGDTSCPVCRESSAAVRAVVVAGFLEGGRAWSARDPAMAQTHRDQTRSWRSPWASRGSEKKLAHLIWKQCLNKLEEQQWKEVGKHWWNQYLEG